MSDPRTNTTIVRETSSGNGGVFFVLGAIVVALGIVLYFVLGDGGLQLGTSGGSTTTSTSVTIEAPAAAEPAAPAAEPAPAAPVPAN